MTTLTGLASIAAFVIAFGALGIVRVAGRAVAVCREATGAVGHGGLDDRARENAARRASLQLFAAVGAILSRTAGATALAALPVVLADAAGVAEASDVARFVATWQGVAIATALAVFAFLIQAVPWRTN